MEGALRLRTIALFWLLGSINSPAGTLLTKSLHSELFVLDVAFLRKTIFSRVLPFSNEGKSQIWTGKEEKWERRTGR